MAINKNRYRTKKNSRISLKNVKAMQHNYMTTQHELRFINNRVQNLTMIKRNLNRDSFRSLFNRMNNRRNIFIHGKHFIALSDDFGSRYILTPNKFLFAAKNNNSINKNQGVLAYYGNGSLPKNIFK